MNILLITSNSNSIISFRGPLINELQKRGHNVAVIAPDFSPSTRDTLDAMGIKHSCYSLAQSSINPVSEIQSILSLRKAIALYKPDYCLSYFTKPVIYGTLAAFFSNVKNRYSLIEGLGFSFTQDSQFNLKRFASKCFLSASMYIASRIASKMIFLNTDDQGEFIKAGLTPANKSAVLGPIGLDLTEWPQHPLPASPVCFLCVGRILRDKGVLEFIDAARQIKADYPAVRFVLAGGLDDNPTGISKAQVEAWVHEGLIEWPGHTQVLPWYQQCHVFVLPSYREGVPRSTQEAMALGRAVITTDVPGCRDTVIDGVNGDLVPARDPAALAAAMRRFIDNPDRIETMGRESRKFAEARFDVHQQNAKLLSLMGL